MSLTSQISALATRVGQEIKALYQSLSVKAKGEHGIYYVQGNTSGTAGTWTGTHAGITSLYAGLTVAYRIGIAGAGTTTLNINALGANTVRRCTGNLTTHLPANTIVILTFDGAYWVWADYTDGNNYDRTYWGNAILAGATIYSYKLLMQAADGKFYPLTLETGTSTTKTVSLQEFILGSPILHYASTATVAAGAALSNVYSEIPMTTLNYTANQGTWIANLPIYLKGTVLANGSFRLDNTDYTSFMTQTLPSTDDGFVYILLGQMYSTTALRLYQNHPVYQYKNGKLRLYESDDPRPITKAMVEAVLTGTITSHDHAGTYATPSDLQDGFTTMVALIGGKQPSDADLTALAGLSGMGLARRTGDGTWALDASAYLTGITKAMVEDVLTGNLVSHTHNYQPYSYDLALIAALTGTSGILEKAGLGNWRLNTTGYEPKLYDGDGSYSVLIIKNSTRYVMSVADAASMWNFVGDGMVTQSKLGEDLTSRQTVAASEIDWSLGGVYTKVMGANTTFTFAGLQLNKVITLILSGNFTATFPAYCKRISGTYDGNVVNYIQFHCTNNASGSEEVWYTISKQAV